jgi:hypothetical protein
MNQRLIVGVQEAFKRPGYELFYLDVWSMAELETCRQLLHPGMPYSEMRDRFDR